MAQSKSTRRTRRPLEQQIEDLERKVRQLEERRASKRAFAPYWLRRHRAKLRLSAEDYGTLIGVSAITIYNWEKGKTSPRDRQLRALHDIRQLGWREAWERLDAVDGGRGRPDARAAPAPPAS